jgi:CRP-like cAMP-binding protein
MTEVVAALKASPLFRGFTDTGLTILASICVQRSYPAGSPLFVEAMVSDSMLVLVDGRVALTSKGSRGESLSMGEVGHGDWLGELALISPGQRMCTATALTPVWAYELRHTDFQRLMGQKPQACIKLLMSICTSLGQKVVDNRDALKSLLKP